MYILFIIFSFIAFSFWWYPLVGKVADNFRKHIGLADNKKWIRITIPLLIFTLATTSLVIFKLPLPNFSLNSIMMLGLISLLVGLALSLITYIILGTVFSILKRWEDRKPGIMGIIYFLDGY